MGGVMKIVATSHLLAFCLFATLSVSAATNHIDSSSGNGAVQLDHGNTFGPVNGFTTAPTGNAPRAAAYDAAGNAYIASGVATGGVYTLTVISAAGAVLKTVILHGTPFPWGAPSYNPVRKTITVPLYAASGSA